MLNQNRMKTNVVSVVVYGIPTTTVTPAPMMNRNVMVTVKVTDKYEKVVSIPLRSDLSRNAKRKRVNDIKKKRNAALCDAVLCCAVLYSEMCPSVMS